MLHTERSLPYILDDLILLFLIRFNLCSSYILKTTLFRVDSPSTKLMKVLLSNIAKDYLKNLFSDFIRDILECDPFIFEIDPRKIESRKEAVDSAHAAELVCGAGGSGGGAMQEKQKKQFRASVRGVILNPKGILPMGKGKNPEKV